MLRWPECPRTGRARRCRPAAGSATGGRDRTKSLTNQANPKGDSAESSGQAAAPRLPMQVPLPTCGPAGVAGRVGPKSNPSSRIEAVLRRRLHPRGGAACVNSCGSACVVGGQGQDAPAFTGSKPETRICRIRPSPSGSRRGRDPTRSAGDASRSDNPSAGKVLSRRVLSAWISGARDVTGDAPPGPDRA